MKVEPVFENFSSPLTLTQNQAEPDILYIADQIGLIYRISDDTVSIFLDIRSKLPELKEKYDEQGLLDFVFHPDYPIDNRIFIFYSTVDRSKYVNYLSEITIESINTDNTNTKIPLLKIEKDTDYHNGGRLTFGSDGYLYLTVGDGGIQRDPDNHGQRLDILAGKILRLDVSTPGMYKIPQDNPFIHKPNALPLIYAYGFRNPWSISFDSSNRLFVADVGFETVEEIDIVVKGGNYGWNLFEGSMKTSFGGSNVTTAKNTYLISPIYEYTHDWIKKTSVKNKDMIAIIGGYPLDDGSYVFADLSGIIMKIKPDSSGKWKLIDSLIINDFIKAFGKDLFGNIYIMTSDKVGPYGNGKIFKVLA